MRKRSKKAKNDKLGYIIIGVVVSLLIAIAVFIAFNRGVEHDKETMCRVDGNFDTHVMILDMSDNYNAVQVQQIKHVINDVVEHLSMDEQLQLYFINNTLPSDMKAELILCNPGDGAGKSEIYSNPKLFKKRWQQRFYKPLMSKIKSISGDYTSDHSPILETIQIVNNLALPYVKDDNHTYKITIISDLIQNSENLSFFKTKRASLEHFVDSPPYVKIRTDLEGVDIDLVIVRRDHLESLQSKSYVNFWVNVLSSMSANIETIKMTDG